MKKCITIYYLRSSLFHLFHFERPVGWNRIKYLSLRILFLNQNWKVTFHFCDYYSADVNYFNQDGSKINFIIVIIATVSVYTIYNASK